MEPDRRSLTIEQILAWADAHHAAHGALAGGGTAVRAVRWSTGSPGSRGRRSTTPWRWACGGCRATRRWRSCWPSSRGAPLPDMRPQALAEKIWAWEQEQFPSRGRGSAPRSSGLSRADDSPRSWPGPTPIMRPPEIGRRIKSGPVRAAPYDVTWKRIDDALRLGPRGLPGGSSLARGTMEHRDVPSTRCASSRSWPGPTRTTQPPARWPNGLSGTVLGAPGENWATWTTSSTRAAAACRGVEPGPPARRAARASRPVVRSSRRSASTRSWPGPTPTTRPTAAGRPRERAGRPGARRDLARDRLAL